MAIFRGDRFVGRLVEVISGQSLDVSAKNLLDMRDTHFYLEKQDVFA